MKKILSLLPVLMIAFTSVSFADETDLKIDSNYYQTRFNKFVCKNTSDVAMTPPAFFADVSLTFEKIVVSITLDQAVVLANYNEGDSNCRYSATFTIDKRKFFRTIALKQSQVVPLTGTSSCVQFKQELDSRFVKMQYLIDYDYVALKFANIPAVTNCEDGASDVVVVFDRIRRR